MAVFACLGGRSTIDGIVAVAESQSGDKGKEVEVITLWGEDAATLEELAPDTKTKGGRDSSAQLIKFLKTVRDFRKFTDDQEIYWKKVIRQLEEGGIPKQTIKRTIKEINNLNQDLNNPLKVLAVLQKNISVSFLESHYAEHKPNISTKREVILSLYLAEE